MRPLTHSSRPVPEFDDERRHIQSLAWVFAFSVLPAFPVGLLLDVLIRNMTGYPVSGGAPAWAQWTAAIPAMAVILAPCVLAVVYGRWAAECGMKSGRWAALFGLIAGVVTVAGFVAAIV